MRETREAAGAATTAENEAWLRSAMASYFFDAMRDEPEAMAILARELRTLAFNERITLADRERTFITATRNVPGSIYRALAVPGGTLRPISYAMFAHSTEPIPGQEHSLEIQRLEFDCKTDAEIAAGLEAGVEVPAQLRSAVAAEVKADLRDFDRAELDRLLHILWLNNPGYVRVSPPRRVAQTLRLLQLGERRLGLHLEVEPMQDGSEQTRVSFAVSTPPHRGFLMQLLEVLNRLDLGVARAYVLEVSTGHRPWALCMFYVQPRDGSRLEEDSALSALLERELFNTQILSTSAPEYRELVTTGVMSGEDASLVRALVAFCHTNLAHAQPDRFDWEEVRNAFHADPQMAAQLVQLFRARFDPTLADREKAFARLGAEAERAVAGYDTGHRHLDALRRDVFRCCLAFIRHTLKTNFFVKEKQAFAFRLDPAYLAALGPAFTSDLPPATPFRVTFFFTRYGFGYHIGFSDIARGGWRTVICRTDDDFLTNAATLFRENFVLAHTQHFKNKDIYEGGSKLVMLMDASALEDEERDQELLRLYKLQRGVINAFLDVFVTRHGVARHPSVVDYYREDEAIELGPDENMHDRMIEEIAQVSRARGYLLGIGVMSSKRVGINHKEYGVTSTGVVKFAEITMKELGFDVKRGDFSVKLTGGPNGDVAGNAMRLMLKRWPRLRVRLVLDGTAALHDPEGADHAELSRLLLKEDLHAFDPRALHPGASLLFRTGSRRAGLREQYRKVSRTARGLREEWLSVDEFSRQWGALVFTVPADLFIPGGGRPETIDGETWPRFLAEDGTPSARAIVEGANSFITPEARRQLQQRGVIIMRDASANKCGVISSSYEIIANLLFSEEEFLRHKARYVKGVLQILERRASEEAHLILARRRESGRPCTEISDALSAEINENYARLFQYFQRRPELCLRAPFRQALLSHLPAMVGASPDFRRRVTRLPPKYRSAILAAELGSSMVYRADREAELEDALRLHLARHFGG
jgi:glutamate dehydrogenase